jgi:uncharacterized membrane protein YhaH (DUF805 family)
MNWRTFFSFRGRLNRARYWLALFIITVAEAILGFAQSASSLSSTASLVIDLLVAVGEVAAFVASLAIMVKRLHDRSKSAWWLLALYLVPALLAGLAVYLSFIANSSVGGEADYAALLFRLCLLGVFAIMVWFFVELGCLRGTVGTNRYGSDPLLPIRPWRTGLAGIDR